MRKSDTPYLADLLAISLRWLVLFGLSISLGTGGVFLPNTPEPMHLAVIMLVLGLPALWNGFVSALAIFNRRLPWHRQVNVTLDILFGLALYLVTGGLSGQVPWVALLPLFSGAVYFEARGAFLVAGIITLIQVAASILMQGGLFLPLEAGIVAGINFFSALIITLLSMPVIHSLRSSYQKTVYQRKEDERNAQRQERNRMRALLEMIETFSATHSYQNVVETVVETAAKALADSTGAVDKMVGGLLLLDEQSKLQLSSARGFFAGDARVKLPGEKGALKDVLKSGTVQLVYNPGEDVELSQLGTMHNQKIALCLPLVRGINAYGLILFGHSQEDFFSQDRIETLQMLTNQTVLALQNARLYQDLSREKERILHSQEQAQKRLARDLHDGPTQAVSSIAMRISIARRLLERSSSEAAEELNKIEDLARRTTQEMRHMLFTLRPLILESEGLAAALHTISDKMLELYQQHVIVEVAAEIEVQLDANQQAVIFYLVEEAVNNARKHAQATEIHVQLQCVPKIEDIAMLEITDNGTGFDVETVMNTYDRRGSLGMVHLRERAEQINGLFKIESAPGKGTLIRVFIPLSEAAADRLSQRR